MNYIDGFLGVTTNLYMILASERVAQRTNGGPPRYFSIQVLYVLYGLHTTRAASHKVFFIKYTTEYFISEKIYLKLQILDYSSLHMDMIQYL